MTPAVMSTEMAAVNEQDSWRGIRVQLGFYGICNGAANSSARRRGRASGGPALRNARLAGCRGARRAQGRFCGAGEDAAGVQKKRPFLEREREDEVALECK
ncbi:hypothetical protein DM860_006921 [Cuscuta australis]|uniref:Uncharacterized protein n=1 Tax=Cuscuta australis TaxID=267555 RepID=A0A328E9G2_9ASTE|nr:hypothetical protein DM860_006921 [Cuscuta australis]